MTSPGEIFFCTNFNMTTKYTSIIFNILIISIVLIHVISAFSLPTFSSPQEFRENDIINIRFKRQNDEVIEEEGSGSPEYDIVESSGEEIIGEK